MVSLRILREPSQCSMMDWNLDDLLRLSGLQYQLIISIIIPHSTLLHHGVYIHGPHCHINWAAQTIHRVSGIVRVHQVIRPVRIIFTEQAVVQVDW